MSVTQVRNFIEKSGCGVVVAVAVGLVMLLGVFTGQCSRGAQLNRKPGEEQASAGTAVGTLGSATLTAEVIDEGFRDAQNQQQSTEPEGALDEARNYGFAVTRVVAEALIADVAKKYGVTVNDADLRKEAEMQAGFQMEQFKGQLQQSGKVPAGASASDIDAAFRKEYNVSIEDATKRLVDGILNDPKQKAQLSQSVIFTQVRDKIKTTIKIDDADLKKAQVLAMVKRIFLPEAEGAKATLEKASSEIKGGTSFEAAMTKYSKDAPSPGKSISEREEPFILSQAFADTKLAAMKNAAVGYVSPVLEVPGGFAIYKVTKVNPPPADFDKNKDTLRTQFQDMAAGTKLQAELLALRESTKPKWTNTGYQALYDATQALDKQGDGRTKGLEEVLKIAPPAEVGKRPYCYAKLLAIENLWPTLKPEDKKSRSTERLEAISNLLEFTDGADLQLSLARTLADNKDLTAGDALLKAAQRNSSYGPRGQQTYGDVSGLLSRLKAEKLIKDEVAAEVTKVQSEWQKTKAEYDAEQKKQAEEQAKQQREAMEEQKKGEAEEKKRQAAEKAKPGSSSAKPGTKEPEVSSSALGGSPDPGPSLPTKP